MHSNNTSYYITSVIDLLFEALYQWDFPHHHMCYLFVAFFMHAYVCYTCVVLYIKLMYSVCIFYVGNVTLCMP